jgi:HAD superfamily hydrolase (TIGR01509 family)
VEEKRGQAPDWKPKAVVFDMDGLLVDTEKLWEQGEFRMFQRRGLAYPREVRAQVIGGSLVNTAVIFAKIFGEEGHETELMAEQLEVTREIFSEGAETMPGAVQMAQLAAAKLPVAVASNSPLELVSTALRSSGLAEIFNTVITADDIQHPKPAPDIYLEACRRLASDPADSLAFEDTVTGVAAAKAAGMRCAGIPSLPATTLDSDWLWPSLADPRLVAWAQAW